MTMQALITAITEGQKKQVRRFAEDAVDCAIEEIVLNRNSMQKLIENGGEFKDRIINIIKELSCQQYTNEEVESSYTYPEDYEIRDVNQQISTLRRFLPRLKIDSEKILCPPLPPNAEGWFAVPRWQSIAETYDRAVQIILHQLETQSFDEFYNFYNNKIAGRYLRRHECAAKKIQMLSDQQDDSDILLIAAQFGLYHRGRSVRRAREVFSYEEFGLGVFETGCMLLTHPKRFSNFGDLMISCPGDRYSLKGNGDFSRVPVFSFNNGQREFFSVEPHHPYGKFGSVSGFILRKSPFGS
jgi:hypothetical protein